MISVAATSTIPQLGFIHEDSANAFCLDIADIFRDEITLHASFGAVKQHANRKGQSIESVTRRHTGKLLQKKDVVARMIDHIKKLLNEAVETKVPQGTTDTALSAGNSIPTKDSSQQEDG